jgi:hypothetical protein
MQGAGFGGGECRVPVEIGLWRVDGDGAVKVAASGTSLESRLERLIATDPSILGEPVMIIGRQVPTAYGTVIDLLAVDDEGTLHILELKRDRTPREVVAQLLDYGSWVSTLSHDEVIDIFTAYRSDVAFEQAFAERFGVAPPEQLNVAQRLTVVAGDVDTATQRIVTYLNTGFGVPVNVVLFRSYHDDGREYVARAWLIDESAAAGQARKNGPGSREPWNGRDWYVSFGEYPDGRDWDDARHYGFVSAGGGAWFSRTIRALPIGGRVFAYIPKVGYVGVGTVVGEARPFDQAVVFVDGGEQELAELPLEGNYHHGSDDEDTAEYVVPVEWAATRPRDEAVSERGLFANQNSACKLRNKFTIDAVTAAFGLTHDDESTAPRRSLLT